MIPFLVVNQPPRQHALCDSKVEALRLRVSQAVNLRSYANKAKSLGLLCDLLCRLKRI